MYAAWRAMSGQMPRVEPHLLTEMLAQKAVNTILWTGGVAPLKAETFAADTHKFGEKLTIYRDGQHIDDDTKYWLSFTTDVDITRGPVVDDEIGRLFYTGDGTPKMTNSLIGWADPGAMPAGFYELGIPQPPPLSLALSGTPDEDAEIVGIVVAYAYVSEDGFVGPLSFALGFNYRPGLTLEVSSLGVGPTGAYNLEKKYVYIGTTDSEGSTALRFWKEVPLASSTTSGLIDFSALAEEATSPSLIAPPSDLFGMMLHPNGFLEGFTTRKYCRSEIWRPHGWPSEYQDPIGDDIVGGCVIGAQTIICTRGTTYSAIGTDPMNQHIQDYSGNYPCTSKRSIKAMTFGALYASPDGLVMAGGPGSQLALVSEAFFTREQWQAFKPESMHACVHDRRYTLFWKVSDTEKGSLIFEFGHDGRIERLIESTQWFSAAFSDGRRDEMYVAGEDGDVYKWDSGDPLTALWRSREIRFGRAENVGAVRVFAEEYPITFRLYNVLTENQRRTIELVSEVQVQSDEPERLHGLDKYRSIYWEIEGTHKWTEVEIGSSIENIVDRNG